MGNFFLDNADIQLLCDHLDLARLATLREEEFRFQRELDFAPEDAGDAVDNYRRVLTALGELAADVIAPTAADTDRSGNLLQEDGCVRLAAGLATGVERLAQAGLMGCTLPYRFGGLNFPQLVATMTNEIVSRADASLMNLYGLQGIGETINAFADEAIKQAYLPGMAAGRLSGAMALTEPDAGSDLQAVKARAFQDGAGNWLVQGVKRFITNGCGDVLLVLARSEPGSSDARGLSLFLVERGARVKVRRLEEKLGIHGSPTCELFFDDAPALLIGQRQRGLVTYVMSLMNGARVAIAAQAVGISEAAYRAAREYAGKRRQFGGPIEGIPAVRELLAAMSVEVQAARALTYHAAFAADLEACTQARLDGGAGDSDERGALQQEARRLRRIAALLTPLAKYYAAEASVRVCNHAMSVLGGSGYMRDYPVERHLRDARITTIYEGTSQLQVVAATGGVVAGVARAAVEELLERPWPDEVAPLAAELRRGLVRLDEAVAAARAHATPGYLDLCGRRLVDMVCTLVIGALLCGQAATHWRKLAVARHWLATRLPVLELDLAFIRGGDDAVLAHFEELATAVS